MKKTFTLILFALFANLLWSQDHIVGVTSNVFTPADITITVGQTIEWQNTDGFHNVNGTTATYPSNPESFGNATGTAWTYQYTFNTAGTYDYQCDPHVSLGMVGTVTVMEAPTGNVNDIVITEIMYNPPEGGLDSLEFIELYNSGSAAVDVGGLSFSAGVTDTLDSQMLGAGEYMIVAVNAAAFTNNFGVPAQQWNAGGLSNGGEPIELIDASGNVIDMVTYDDAPPWSTVPDGNGASLVLCDPLSDNSDPANWKAATTPTGVIINGTEISANPNAASGCPTGPVISFLGSEVTVGEDGDIVDVLVAIENGTATETTVDLMISPSSTATLDFDYTLGFFFPTTITFPAGVASDTQTVSIAIIDDLDVEPIENVIYELSNPTNTAIIDPSFSSYQINILDNDAPMVDLVINEIMYNPPEGGSDSTEYIEILNNGASAVDLDGYFFSQGVTFTFPAMMLGPGEYVVVTESASAYQSYYGTTALQWDDGALGNGGEPIALSNAGGSMVDMVEYDDAIPWPTVADGNGPSLVLCDPNSDNSDPANWSVEEVSSGVVIGGVEIFASPGALNTCAIISGPTYPPYDIGVVTGDSNTDGLPDSIGVTTELTGVVYGIDLNGGNPLQFTIIDANNDGIGIFEGDMTPYVVNEGDEVTIRGTINHFRGLAQIAPDEIIFNSAGNALFNPTLVTSLGEDTESQLVVMENMELVDATQWDNSLPTSGSGFNVDITDGTNTFLMRIDNDNELYNLPAPATPFHVTGIGGQFDTDNMGPFDTDYQLLPRYAADIVPITSTNDLELGRTIKVFPNPVNTLLELRMENTVDVIRVHNILGQEIVDLRNPQLNEQLNVSNWKAGIYAITFVSGNRIYTTQFVKQ